MTTITTRSGKGSALTHTEMDNNFSNLNTDKLEAANLTTYTGNITSGNLAVTNTITAATVDATTVALQEYKETVIAVGTTSGTFTPNVATGTVQTLTLNGNLTFIAFTNPVAGQSATFIVTQDGSGNRGLTSTMKFAGNVREFTLDADAIDVMSVVYDGSNYYAALTKGYE